MFPNERANIKRFYHDMLKMYQHVMMEVPTYNTADETDPVVALKSLLRHPMSYLRFLGYLNTSAQRLLEKYFTDPEIFKFFDKLTSTYCYATVEEAPAVLAAVMFVNNHVGGSYYPAGSTLFLPGKLEQVIEANGGDMLLQTEVLSLIFKDGNPRVSWMTAELFAPDIIYSGTVWNLTGNSSICAHTAQRAMGQKQVPLPQCVLYAVVDRSGNPGRYRPIEMLVGNPDRSTKARLRPIS